MHAAPESHQRLPVASRATPRHVFAPVIDIAKEVLICPNAACGGVQHSRPWKQRFQGQSIVNSQRRIARIPKESARVTQHRQGCDGG